MSTTTGLSFHGAQQFTIVHGNQGLRHGPHFLAGISRQYYHDDLVLSPTDTIAATTTSSSDGGSGILAAAALQGG